jgi:RNA-directed DNA polymerase
VHHALCNIIVPIFERTFIADSYANRVGFGTHRALRRCTKFARSSRYVLQCDIRKYFPSIDHNILKSLIRRKLKCPDTLWLIDTIINNSNEQEDCFTKAYLTRSY